MFGGILFIAGLTLGIRIFLKWRALGYGELFEIRSAIIVLTLIAMSIQLIFFSFFVSSLMLKEEFE